MQELHLWPVIGLMTLLHIDNVSAGAIEGQMAIVAACNVLLHPWTI